HYIWRVGGISPQQTGCRRSVGPHVRSRDMMTRLSSLIPALTLIGLLLVPAAARGQATEPAGTDFLRAAKTVTDSIQEKYWMPNSKLYRTKPDSQNVEMMWGNGIMFSAL